MSQCASDISWEASQPLNLELFDVRVIQSNWVNDDVQGMKFSGFRMNPSSPNDVRYFLVFHDDVLYLERFSSVYDDICPVGSRIADVPNVPLRQEGLVKSIS